MKVASSPLILTLLGAWATSTVHARGDFLPSSSIKNKRSSSSAASGAFISSRSAALDLSKSSLPQARGGGSILDLLDKDKRIAKITYYSDLLWGGSTLVFLILWLRSMAAYGKPNYVNEFPNFNAMVLNEGFCNAISPSPWPPTQTLCGIVDLILVLGSYFLAGDIIRTPDGKLKPFYLGSAIYTLIHGFTHYSVEKNPSISTGPLWDKNNLGISLVGTALLSVVMIFAPAILWMILDSLDISNALPLAGGYWAAVVAVFVMALNRKEFALTYINVTIFLTIYGLRPFLIGKDTPDDIERRVSQTPSNIPLYLITTTAAIGIMCMEPLVCKDWFESVGGHVWFDVALFALLFNSVLA